MNLRLYRGITLSKKDVDDVINDIKNNGLDISEHSFWKGGIVKNLKKDLDTLFKNPKLSLKDTSPASIWVHEENCKYVKFTEGDNSLCFADKIGATYYAVKHNVIDEKNIPIIIEANVNINDVFIDGRDFLYSVLRDVDLHNKERLKRQKESLKQIYGARIERYIDKIIENPESDKFAIIELITQDNEIIKDHFKNDIVIGGRYETVFCSAFNVKVPIMANNILSVQRLNSETPIPEPRLTAWQILQG